MLVISQKGALFLRILMACSGNTVDEASLHALYELLERDAYALLFNQAGLVPQPSDKTRSRFCPIPIHCIDA